MIGMTNGVNVNLIFVHWKISVFKTICAIEILTDMEASQLMQTTILCLFGDPKYDMKQTQLLSHKLIFFTHLSSPLEVF